jgi:SsrA-binding protein
MAKEKKEAFAKTVNIRNKRATFEYQILDTYVAGIMLTGTEIKSIRQSRVSLQDAYCYFSGDALSTAKAPTTTTTPCANGNCSYKRRSLRSFLANCWTRD